MTASMTAIHAEFAQGYAASQAYMEAEETERFTASVKWVNCPFCATILAWFK
jgi:hypothetical protein